MTEIVDRGLTRWNSPNDAFGEAASTLQPTQTIGQLPVSRLVADEKRQIGPSNQTTVSDGGARQKTVDGAFFSRAASNSESGQNLARATSSVVGMQKWTGRVIEVDSDLFTVELNDETDDSPLYADFETALLSPDSVEPGDVVYITVRTVVAPGGYRTKTSTIRLRRLGVWTRREVDAINTQARRLQQQIADLSD